jgi:NAD(P)-dependent dehydrogenase (short-subunit alcohol dehydrogenase family)
MHLYVITGTSRGLGAAVAEQVLAPQTLLLAISRGANPGLAAAAARRGAQLQQWQLDLADPPAAAGRLQRWLEQQSGASVRSATLINNAAALAPAGPVDAADDALLSSVLRVDVEAPILLSAAFLRATRGWPAQRRILNISSGAGRNAYAGWAIYCAAKAALDHFARAVALDEERRDNGARIASLAPGVIDTAMQTQLRASDPGGFPDRQRFIDMHQRGELASPQAAAARVLACLNRVDFGSQPVVDVRSI